MGEYINTFTSGLGKVNFWNRKRDTNLVLGHACHIEFDFYGRCASLAPLPGWFLLVPRFGFHSKIKGLPYSDDNNEISKFEGFGHKILS